MKSIEMDSQDWCDICSCVIPEGTEHNYLAHGSTKESADELEAWKKSFEQ